MKNACSAKLCEKNSCGMRRNEFAQNSLQKNSLRKICAKFVAKNSRGIHCGNFVQNSSQKNSLRKICAEFITEFACGKFARNSSQEIRAESAFGNPRLRIFVRRNPFTPIFRLCTFRIKNANLLPVSKCSGRPSRKPFCPRRSRRFPRGR